MKKLLFISTISLILYSCSKETNLQPTQSTTNPCNIDLSLFKDIVWNPPADKTAFLSKLLFTSSGQYWQNQNNQGTWTLKNGCDSIYVVRPGISNFYSKIISVTSSKLIITNPVFGELTYYK